MCVCVLDWVKSISNVCVFTVLQCRSKQTFNPKSGFSVRRAVSWRRATSVTLSTWAATSTSRVPSSTPPLCWATRAGWPDTRWPSTRPSPNWPRTTSPSDTGPETSSCTPTCEYSTEIREHKCLTESTKVFFRVCRWTSLNLLSQERRHRVRRLHLPEGERRAGDGGHSGLDRRQ